jgi:RimJ/RimL family protein N-acetyltransferase
MTAAMSDQPDAGPASRFSRQITLRNGTPVLIRVARPEDRDKVVAAFNALEPDSVYTRFFSARKALTAAELDRLSTSDFVNFVGLVAFAGSGTEEAVIGGATYVALPPAGGTRAAEVAFTIEEDVQGQGLASQLMALLTAIAREHGFHRFEADVLAGNGSMLKVFERSGLPLAKTRDGGVTHVVMDLGQAGGQDRGTP